MPGLIQSAMPQQQPEAQPAQAQPNQQAVERVVVAAIKILHDPKIMPRLIELMKAAGDPVQALVEATMLIMKQLWEKSRKSIPADVLGAASAIVLQLIGELAAAAKLFDVTPELLAQAAAAGLEQFKRESAAAQAQPSAAPAQPSAAPATQPVAAGV